MWYSNFIHILTTKIQHPNITQNHFITSYPNPQPSVQYSYHTSPYFSINPSKNVTFQTTPFHRCPTHHQFLTSKLSTFYPQVIHISTIHLPKTNPIHNQVHSQPPYHFHSLKPFNHKNQTQTQISSHKQSVHSHSKWITPLHPKRAFIF